MPQRVELRAFRFLGLSLSGAILAFLAASWPVPQTVAAQQEPPKNPATLQVPPTPGVSEWSDVVWRAVHEGNLRKIEDSLKTVPDGKATAAAERIRESVAERHKHAEASEQSRTTDVEKASKDISTQLEKGDISQALTAAVKLQTLSDDWKLPLERDDVKALIAKATDVDAQSQTSGDWLLSQEILFRLRTLYEDSGDRSTFKKYDDALEKVNRRIGLMAQYAPKQLYELRKKAYERVKKADEAEGKKTEKFTEWNDAFSNDWKDAVKGITKNMLAAGLKTAAGEHISARGWQPLLRGGIDALAIVATTDALVETFPGLKDPEKVKEFQAAVDRGRLRIGEIPAEKLERLDYGDVMKDLLETNDRTIELPNEVLFHEFGDGALDELAGKFEDQYSEIIWPERLRRFEQQVNGDFVGVGILIRHNDKRDIMVVNPLEGSPAAHGGIKAEDIIAKVNGVDTTGWTLNKAVDEITGPPGQQVTLTIRRVGKELDFDVPLIRDTIKIRSVNGWWKKGLDPTGAPQWDYWIDRASGIGYIRLTSFNEDSFNDFRAAIAAMKADRSLNGLILDLRYNPGGLLKSAVEFTNVFVPAGEVVSGEDRKGQQVWSLPAQPNRADLVGLPVVVLVNQGSASASEIVAGALQAHDAAVIIGERSFGKGSVQTVHDISDGKSAAGIKLTTQYYILPAMSGEAHGRCVHKKAGSTDWGVNPDLVVKMAPEQIKNSVELRQEADIIEEWKDEKDRKPRPDPKDLLAKNFDPQLEMALLVMRARVLKDIDAEAIAAKQ